MMNEGRQQSCSGRVVHEQKNPYHNTTAKRKAGTTVELCKSVQEQFKLKQKREFDRAHRTRALPIIPDNIKIWMASEKE